MKATLFHNPRAGEADWPAERILAALRDTGIRADYHSVKEDGWRAAVETAAPLILVAGGDGTVEKIAVAMRGRQATLAILPTGGANNVARWLGIRGCADRVARNLFGARLVPLHIAEVACRDGLGHVVEAVGVGALARAEPGGPAPTREEKRRRGRDALRAALRDGPPVCGEIVLDGEPLARPVLLAEVMNVGIIGPNLPPARDYEPADGRLAVVWLPVEAREAMLDWLDDPEAAAPPVQLQRARRVRLVVPNETLRVADKQVPRERGAIVIERTGTPLRVLVPAS